jgi:hypothetical protein
MDRDSSIGIATRYGRDGPRIESRWGARFSAPVQNVPGSHPVSYTMDTGSYTGVKRPGRGVDHTAPSSAEVKERVELFLFSLFGPSWPCSRVSFTFTFTLYNALVQHLRTEELINSLFITLQTETLSDEYVVTL